MSVSPENSRRIANLSFVCACCVVLIHEPWPSDFWGFRSILTTTAVQYFFVVAGYMLAAHCAEPGWWKTAVARRVGSLLVPYVLWMAITTILLWLLTGERPLGFGNSGLDLRKVPLLVPLWFVRGLFLLVLASPLIQWALKRWGRLLLAVEFLAVGAVSAMLAHGGWTIEDGWGGFLVYGFPLEGLLYFSVGLWLRDHPVAWHADGRRRCILLATLAVIALRLAAGAGLFRPYCDLTFVVVPFCLATLWYAIPAAHWPQVLVGNAFPIYVMHAVVLAVLWNLPTLRGRCPFWVAVACGILVPVLVGTALKRKFPRVAGTLFGGRIK